jgi:hypothetical protein
LQEHFSANIPNFPPKLFKLFMTDDSLKERKIGLDQYFRGLPNSIRDSDLLKDFFSMLHREMQCLFSLVDANDTDLKTRPIFTSQQSLLPPKLVLDVKEV